jgi:hypothetical protein
MSELRKVALDHAVTVASMVRTDRIDATAVVAAAEAFYAFLTSQHPSPVAAGYDLARADQSPVTSILRDADSIPTRLVRRDGTPPDAA